MPPVSGPSAPRTQKALPVTFPKAKTEGEWYSRSNRRGEGEVEVLLDQDGKPTTGYPHVHVIHDEKKGEVRLHNTMAKGVHQDKVVLPGTVTGNQVNAAVDRLRSLMMRRSRK